MPLVPRNSGSSPLFGQAHAHLEKIHGHLSKQTDLLSELVESKEIQTELKETYWLRNNGVSNAGGTVQVPLENRTGYGLELVSFTAQLGTSNAGAQVLFYLNSQEPQNLIWVSAAFAQYDSDKFRRGMVVPVNAVILAVVIGAGAANNCFVNVFTESSARGMGNAYQSQPKGF